MVISPAKTLDFETASPVDTFTQPEHLKHSKALIKELKDLTPADLSQLMGISDQLAGLNVARFQEWKTPFTEKNAKQAIYAFKGDVYTGLDAESLSKREMNFAQKHLRILSGLYGLLKPYDLIQPYRLEMGTKFTNARGKDLYEFWGSEITESLNSEFKALKSDVLVNLASNEYFKSVKKKELAGEIITPVFKDYKNGQYKIISFFAKKARGMMSAYVIKNKITAVEDIKSFDFGGYSFSAKDSKEREWVFTRKEPV